MASNCTEHYNLNQWAPEDRVMREDFNADNAAVDAALAGIALHNCKLYMGSYVGTGNRASSADSENAVVLKFPFRPMVVFMHLELLDAESGVPAYHILFRDKTSGYNSSGTQKSLSLVWGEDSVTLHTTSSGTAAGMFNGSDTTYRYIALGI